jgi:hypothetical protein
VTFNFEHTDLKRSTLVRAWQAGLLRALLHIGPLGSFSLEWSNGPATLGTTLVKSSLSSIGSLICRKSVLTGSAKE